MSRHNDVGRQGEQAAAKWLKKQGYRLITANYRCRYGEIDIIAQDGDTLVFVEVKTRAAGGLAAGREAVTRSKQAKLRATAQLYLQRLPDATPARFDVLEVTMNPDGTARIEQVKDAF